MKWDQWVLLLGGRYDWASTDSTTKTISSGTKSKSSLDSKAFTGRVGLVYLFDNGLAPYASYAESFNPQSGTGYGGSVFKPTEGKQYEIGIKYQPPGSNSFITAAIFDLRQSNVPTMDRTRRTCAAVAAARSRTASNSPVALNWKARPASTTT